MESKYHMKLFYLFFFLLILLHTIVMGLIRLYPFIDLPMHLASATIFRLYGNPDNAFQQFYTLKKLIAQPNIFHLIFCALKIFPSAELANKLFYCFYVVLLPLSTLYLIKKLGGNPWFSLLSFLCLYNFNVGWGFVGWTIAIPMVLLFIAVLYDYLFRFRIQDIIIIFLLLLIMYHMHAMAALISMLILIVTVFFFHRTSFLNILKRSIVLIPIVILFILWLSSRASHVASGQSILQKLFDYYRHSYFPSFAVRKGFFYWDHFFLHSGTQGHYIGLFFSLFIIIISFFFLGSSKHKRREITRSKPFQLSLICFIVPMIIYLCVSQIRGMFQISYFRFTVFCFLFMIIMGSVLQKMTTNRFKLYLIFIVCFFHFLLWTDYFSDFQKENQAFSKNLFPETSKDQVLTALIYRYTYRGQPIYIHFPNYYIVWKKGIATTRMVDFPSPWRIGARVDVDVLPRYNEWIGMLKNYDDRYSNVDYILLRGKIPEKDVKHLEHFKVINHVEPWAILQNSKK